MGRVEACTLAWLAILAFFVAQDPRPAALTLLLSAAAIASILMLQTLGRPQSRG